ncbi:MULTISPECIES: helix-turn-helix domain-containing protein [Streptomyces]|uniref:helix-turn-helix domain-containing protein n=1 Tax=Streptomyces TaxID=1883 RepID=UPI00163C3ABE|nr:MULTISPECIES: helix-turn-helix transcriptional regulator [Streptomyces]MBC2878425.1 helix-turn-helix transcriptional regulator [Streptomyces sp. TYQ1024]UBI38761.1 helix-turn-helix transcriptional regulator [Streptomyces mobaraensis]UKW31342.1 helix-turn-helix transcriptional regulator [Streptomyces sp. TYQ1024]
MATEDDSLPDPTSSMLAFFGSELNRIRRKAGKSQTQAAEMAHTTQAMISYVERAKRVPSEALAHDLDSAFETDGHFGRLHPLVIKFAYPSWFLPYVEMEREATSLSIFNNQLIHGLLQTEEYARAVLAGGRPDSLEDLVAARMTRQDIFEKETPPHAWFVLDEYALARPYPGPAAMKEQLQHLLTVGERPRTVIQIIPRNAPPHPGVNGSFNILSFETGADVLHVDGITRGHMTADPAEVLVASRSYDLIRAVALSPRESADVIRTYLKELSP